MTEGKDSASLLVGLEPGFELVCIPCNCAGKRMEAEGYCADCCIHLCSHCSRYHRTLPVLKHHKLMDKASMPLAQTDPLTEDICTKLCEIHRGKVIEYFCTTHKVLGCSVCVTLKHKQCEDVAYIPEISADLEQSEEYKKFRQRLDKLIRKSEVIIKSSKENMNHSAYLYSKVRQDISAFRQEIDTALDQLEDEMKIRCDQINLQNIDTMETVSKKANQTLGELQAISSDYQELLSSKQYCQAFTKLKNTNLWTLENKLKNVDDIKISYYRFRPSDEFIQMLKVKDALGKVLVINPDELIATCVRNVNVRTKENKKECIIRGMTLLSKDRLVATDLDNGAVKLIDLVHNKVASELKPEMPLWTATAIGKDKVAVTLPHARKILFLRCNDELVIDAEVDVRGICYDVAYYQDKLVVAFSSPSKVEILSMTGEVLQSFEKDDEGNKLFIDPRYVSMHSDGSSVFVSDWGNNSLIKLSLDGKIQAVYRDDELRRPSQCVIDETGLVYLCGENSSNIHLLTTECTRIKIILDITDGRMYPCSTWHCEATRKLYVGMRRSDHMKVYQLNA